MQVESADGLALDVFTTPRVHLASVVFVNALGIPEGMTGPLRQGLFGRGLNFVTWNLRGSPGNYDAAFRRYSTQSHITDLLTVIRALSLTRVVLVGWCSGIEVVLGAVASGAIRVQGLVLLNSPYFFGAGPYRGVRGDSLYKLSTFIVANETRLPFLYRTILENAAQEAEHKLRITDSTLRGLVLSPFLNGAENLLRYACLMTNTAGVPTVEQWSRAIDLPTHIVGGARDQLVSVEDSFSIARLIRHSQVRVFPDWDHYGLYTHADVAAAEIAGCAAAWDGA